MRWSVKLLVLLAAAGIGALILLKLLPHAANQAALSLNVSPSSPALLARAEADPSRNTRGREFLRRVYARAHDSAAATNTAGFKQIGSVLESGEPDAAKARHLLELAPTLTDEARMEAADHAVNLVVNADYEVLRGALANPQTPEPVLEILLADLLNRGNSLKLPTLVEIARQPEHPRATEARDLLELHIGEDHGTNWAAWLGAARIHIAEHGE